MPILLSGDWLLGLALAAAIALTYVPIWWAGYIWDDDAMVTTNTNLLSWHGLTLIWTTSAADICPLTLTTLWFEHALWGLTPLPYHLVNVLMQIGAAVVLWRVLRELRLPGAWLGAALWALHPVQVESVAWIAEAKNTESGLFFLLSIFFFLRDEKAGSYRNEILTVLFAALAMASKSSTVVLPVVLILCAWWKDGRWNRQLLRRTAPIFVLSIIAGLVSISTQKAMGSDEPRWLLSFPQKLVLAGDAFWFYLGKLLWPHPLVMVYPRWHLDAARWTSYLPLLAAAVAFSCLWLKRRTWGRPYFFAFAFFLIAVAPVLGLVNMTFFANSFVADHFQYLASMGPLVLAGVGISRCPELLGFGKPWLPPVLGGLVLATFATISWQREWAYQDAETVCRDTVAQNPLSWSSYNNLGNALLAKGESDEAIAAYDQALQINPQFANPLNNIGNIYFQQGNMDAAKAKFLAALAAEPDDPGANYNLGNVFLREGKLDTAIYQFQKALKHDSKFVVAYENLGDALFEKGDLDGAAVQFRNSLEINEASGVAHNNLGNVYLKKRQYDQAIEQFHAALKINSAYLSAHRNLGLALADTGHYDEAIAQFQECLRIQPDDKAAALYLAKVQAAAAQQAH
jgi:Tfp pilus assembly protein PilF